MTTNQKGHLIGLIVRELKLKSMELHKSAFCEGDAFFSLAFKSEKELLKISKLCGINI